MLISFIVSKENREIQDLSRPTFEHLKLFLKNLFSEEKFKLIKMRNTLKKENLDILKKYLVAEYQFLDFLYLV